MENNCFYSMIDSLSSQLRFYWNTKKRDNSEISIATLKGVYYTADSIRNILSYQESINKTYEYIEFINLLENIEKDLNILKDN